LLGDDFRLAGSAARWTLNGFALDLNFSVTAHRARTGERISVIVLEAGGVHGKNGR
jgi:hypothetical protein